MTDAQIHYSELDNWNVIVRHFDTLDFAIICAQDMLQRTSKIVLWPLKGGWMVIARFSMLN
jgi:hypothetical protein